MARLRGSVHIEHSLARLGAEKFWRLLHSEPVIARLGLHERQPGHSDGAGRPEGHLLLGLAGGRRRQYRRRDVSRIRACIPVDSVPKMVERINNALLRTDQIHHMDGKSDIDWLAPIIADAEAGFGGNLNAFELTKALIRAGAAAVHFEDQLSSAKKCGHLGGKVLVSTGEAINKLVAARLAADVLDVPTVIIARTDADAADSAADRPRSARRALPHRASAPARDSFTCKAGIEQAIDRGLSYAPYADLMWCETSKPDMAEARRFAAAIHAKFPGKLLAYNCSPSFNWQAKLNAAAMKQLARGAGGAGLSLPVHHARRLARAESVDVRTGRGLSRGRHARLFAAAAARVRPGKRRAIAPPSTRPSSAPAISMRCRPPSAPERIPPARWPAAPRPSSSRRP